MRVGFALSAIVHLAILLVVYVAFANPRLFGQTPTETIAVDIVPADEVPPAKEEQLKIDLPVDRLEQKAESPPPPRSRPASPRRPKQRRARRQSRKRKRRKQAPPPKPDAKETKQAAQPQPSTAPAQPSQPDQTRAGQQMAANAAPSPQQQQPDPFAPDAVPKPLYFPTLQNLEQWAADYDFDALADSAAALTRADIAAFREHLEKCWKPPAALAQSPKLQAVLRIALKPDGAMAAEPILVKASASAQGPALVDTATRALRQCQPFGFLPADKYSEWKILELSFTPRGLGG